MTQHKLSRRTMLALGLGALSAGASDGMALKPAHQPYLRIGAETSTVDAAYKADPLGALRQIKALGYDSVELSTLVVAPAEMRRWLDDIGLDCPSAMIAPDDWRNGPEAALDGLATLGVDYAINPWLIESWRVDWAETGAKVNHWGELCAARGLKFAYHNHDWEFRAVNGIVPFEAILAHTDPDLVFWELDVYWARFAGRDPLAIIEALGDRIRLLHLKDMDKDGKMTSVGSGIIDFSTLLQRAMSKGVKHVFVEHDQPKDPWVSLRKSLAYLRS